MGFGVIALLILLLSFGLHAQEPTPNDRVQDTASVARDARQEGKIDEVRDTANAAQDSATAAGNRAQDVQSAMNSRAIDSIQEQDINDRQFMAYILLAFFGVLTALWLMLRGVVTRLNKATVTLVARTEMLEAHIQETTPWVVEAYQKNRD